MIQQPRALFWSTMIGVTMIASRVGILAQEPETGSPVFLELPQGIASFGAAQLEDYVYVYSGHTGKTHVYSLDAMSKGFFRASLKQGGSWECLPMERAGTGRGTAGGRKRIVSHWRNAGSERVRETA